MSEPETFLDGRVTLHAGDCLAVLDTLPAASIDACVTDPPYHFASIVKRFGARDAAPAKDGAFERAARGFMGKQWDGGDVAFRPETWAKVLRVLKPGAHLVAFAAPKNVGHLQVAIEAAGFECRDCLIELLDLDMLIAAFVESLTDEQCGAFLRCIDDSSFGGLLAWIFGSGFPKSHDVSKAIDKKFGIKRPVIGRERLSNDIRGGALLDAAHDGNRPAFERDITAPGSPHAQKWDGWGTALKPAFEPIVLARRPLAEGCSIAGNVLAFGTGAVNIDACRVGTAGGTRTKVGTPTPAVNAYGDGIGVGIGGTIEPIDGGRWPANVLTDGSDAATDGFPDQAGGGSGRPAFTRGIGGADKVLGGKERSGAVVATYADAGSAARFFYTAKADADDRLGSKHPTVKPLDLMQWLIRLVTPKGGTVLDLFAGTGTTGEAAFREGMRAVLIEREAEYREDIRRRMRLALGGQDERAREAIKAKLKDKPPDLGPLFDAA